MGRLSATVEDRTTQVEDDAGLVTTSVTGNTATDDGGGVFNTPGGRVMVSSNVTVSQNAPNDCSSC